MKRLFNLMLAVLLMVMLSACGKPDSSADKVSEQYGQTKDAETTELAQQEQSAASKTTQTEVQTENNLTDEQEQQTQGGDNTVAGDISFNFETKTVLLNSGVRLIDTAYMYHNEESVGEAVRNSGIPREEIFVITKLYPNQFSDPEAAIEEALAKLDIEYIEFCVFHGIT